MKVFKSAASIVLAVLCGVALGGYFSRPKSVHASSVWINVQKVREGNNMKGPLSGSTTIGFACNQDGCFVATTD